MAVRIETGDIFQETCFTKHTDQLGLMVLTWRVLSQAIATGFDPAYETLANVRATQIGPAIRPALHIDAIFQGVTLRRIFPTVGPSVQSTPTQVLAGGNAGDVMPRQVSGIIKKFAAGVGRHGRGRMYVPFPAEINNTVGGLPDAAYQTALSNLALQFTSRTITTNTGTTTTIEPVLFDRVTHNAVSVSGYLGQAKWATQRRRGSFGKINTSPF